MPIKSYPLWKATEFWLLKKDIFENGLYSFLFRRNTSLDFLRPILLHKTGGFFGSCEEADICQWSPFVSDLSLRSSRISFFSVDKWKGFLFSGNPSAKGKRVRRKWEEALFGASNNFAMNWIYLHYMEYILVQILIFPDLSHFPLIWHFWRNVRREKKIYKLGNELKRWNKYVDNYHNTENVVQHTSNGLKRGWFRIVLRWKLEMSS